MRLLVSGSKTREHFHFVDITDCNFWFSSLSSHVSLAQLNYFIPHKDRVCNDVISLPRCDGNNVCKNPGDSVCASDHCDRESVLSTQQGDTREHSQLLEHRSHLMLGWSSQQSFSDSVVTKQDIGYNNAMCASHIYFKLLVHGLNRYHSLDDRLSQSNFVLQVDYYSGVPGKLSLPIGSWCCFARFI